MTVTEMENRLSQLRTGFDIAIERTLREKAAKGRPIVMVHFLRLRMAAPSYGAPNMPSPISTANDAQKKSRLSEVSPFTLSLRF